VSRTYLKSPPSKVRSLPRRLLNHAGGGGTHGRRAEYAADQGADARPMPSLPVVRWLLRPEIDERKPDQCPERRK
jgi:hypothetical protein